MTPGDDELDPSDWLAAQFGEEPARPAKAPDATAPAAPPLPPSPSEPPALTPPAAGQPFRPGGPDADRYDTALPPVTPPVVPPPAGGPFQWGLTPGAEPAPAPVPPPVAPSSPPPAQPMFPVEPPAAVEPPTAAPPPLVPPGQWIEPVPAVAPDPAQWFAAPLDPALDGVTEVFEAELVGLTGPTGEGPAASALDDLFGDSQFRDFADEPLIPPRPQASSGGGRRPRTAREPRAPIPRNQKILMWVAGGLVAALALVALFALGMKLASIHPAPAVLPSSSPSPSAAPNVPALGPVAPGDHHWDELLGGECLDPYQSAWQDDYTVVDCAKPHPAQMVYRGIFADLASSTYPGTDELQKRINLLCTAPTVIDYAAAGSANDIQVAASYAVDADEWDAGNRSFYCFVTRAAGAAFTASIAVPQAAVTPTPTPAPTESATPGAPAGRGHADGPPKS